MRDSTSAASISMARRRFFDSGMAPNGLVPDTILASWQRCISYGLDASARPELALLERHQLGELHERHESLRRLCRPEMEALFTSADHAGAIVVLTTPDGFVLDALGNAQFMDKASRVALRPGVAWNEHAIGTNAIGTALVERRSVEVRGGEHYYMPHRVLSCSASPILGPCGEVIGVLDLSGEAAAHSPHALGMVQLSVEQIERRLFKEKFKHREIVRIQPDALLLGSLREGLLVFEGHRLVAANRYALKLLGVSWDELGKCRYDELFASALPPSGSIGQMRSQSGEIYYASRSGAQREPLRGKAVAMPVKPTSTPAPVFTERLEAAIQRGVRLLDADIPLLLQGETGTGKEVVARELHRRSQRSARPFVAVNCAALPEGLIEAELFGYSPGAFTGARRDGSVGLLREANGGVLFLDELGDMPLTMQSRLLRVLQEREVMPLGGGRAQPLDIVVVAATHRDLVSAVQQGGFRADLYYRIAQSTLALPSLRDYPELPALIRELWQSLGAEKACIRLHPELLDQLARHPWPGNLRQLVGQLRSLIALGEADSTLTCADLSDDSSTFLTASTAAALVSGEDNLQTLELKLLNQVLADYGGNVAATARKLGISRSTIYRRLRDNAELRT